jgi:hypothetical protein
MLEGIDLLCRVANKLSVSVLTSFIKGTRNSVHCFTIFKSILQCSYTYNMFFGSKFYKDFKFAYIRLITSNDLLEYGNNELRVCPKT